MLVFCAVAVWQVLSIPESTIQSEVGPILAPAILVALLSLLGVFYLLSAISNKAPDCIHQEEDQPLNGGAKRVSYLLGGGLAFILLAKLIGFLIPATLCGLGVSMAFDAKFNVKTVLMVLAIAGAFWTLFSAILGVDLGPLVNLSF
nr:tripartite tricarboxylate transporter TctB family protein [Polynucleobacter sp. 15G-AUS-farblos]